MIVTVTTNPSLDRTYELEGLDLGEVNRSRRDRVEASGKGVNVSRALHAAGVATTALLTSGGPEGRHLLELLALDGLAVRALPVSGSTRTNVTLLGAGGRTTKVNAPGAPLTRPEAEALVRAVSELAGGARWVVCSGSLPPKTDPALVARLVTAAQSAGARVAVDASGPALAAAVDAGPDLLAPNAAELSELVGRPLPDLAAVTDAAVRVAGRTGGEVLTSLGADGALWVTDRTARIAVPPAVRPVNTAGAGDALLAGWLAATVGGPSRPPVPDVAGRLAHAVAWGTAACLMTDTAGDVARHADPAAVRVRALEHLTTDRLA